MTLLTALDQYVEIVIRAKPQTRAAAKISVVGCDGLVWRARGIYTVG